ncbi:MAG: glutamine synthetase family protein [Pseudomonadota bacterium]
MEFDDLSTLRIAACDLNGQMRGKRMPVASATKLEKGAMRMPFSALNVDLWGADIDGSPLVFESGDQDATLRATDRGPVPMPWLAHPSALIPVSMYHDDGMPFDGDPRHALARVLDRYAARGWRVLAATELEFTLVDDSGPALRPPVDPQSGRRCQAGEVLSLRYMDAYDAYFSDLYSGAQAMGIPADAAISESGIGQFEINLTHQDAMRAADDTWLFKELVKGLARKHGMAATFMAKPYPEDAGNGMHVHFSVLDRYGDNVFDDGGQTGTEVLRSAISGCLAALPDCTLIFAPHGNSFDRLVPGAHAPTAALWGYENRTAAIRVPGGPSTARRIEHRVAGGDTNPYLMLTAILGGALVGIEDDMTAPAPIAGNAYEVKDAPGLATSWQASVDWFEDSPLATRIFSAELLRNLVMTKRQEIRRFAELPSDLHWQSWLETV